MSETRLSLIGYPFCCGRSQGMPLAVRALRQAGIVERLSAGRVVLDDRGDLDLALPGGQEEGDPRARNLPLVAEAARRLAQQLSRVDGHPVILGGDCTVVLGSARVLGERFPDLGVIYVDAHGDYNTPETTPSGFIDGMCLASAAGLGPPALTEGARLAPERIVLFGGRDFDPPELDLIRTTGVSLIDMTTIRRQGLGAAARRGLDALGGRPTLLHIDLDVLDSAAPQGLPAVDVPAPGGLSWEELGEAAQVWAQQGSLVGLEFTAYNPLKDPPGRWAGRIVEMVASIVGSVRG